MFWIVRFVKNFFPPRPSCKWYSFCVSIFGASSLQVQIGVAVRRSNRLRYLNHSKLIDVCCLIFFFSIYDQEYFSLCCFMSNLVKSFLLRVLSISYCTNCIIGILFLTDSNVVSIMLLKVTCGIYFESIKFYWLCKPVIGYLCLIEISSWLVAPQKTLLGMVSRN